MQSFNHGFLILDKPTGMSSAKAVSEVKKILGCAKIGHGGTLDPLASGILPLAIGEATKAFEYVASSRKEYRFTITLGEQRATDDAEGEVTATTDHIPAREEILAVLPQFTGTIMQVPPIYSALKIDGERAYKKARAGEQVEMVARPVEVQELELLELKGREATLRVRCGKGTYVRSLARDIASKCNSLGYVSMLRRASVGKFHEEAAISLDKLPGLVHNAELFKAWLPIELALDDIPAIDADSVLAAKLRHGQTAVMLKADGRYMVLHQGKILALADCRGGVLRTVRVFNLNEEGDSDVARTRKEAKSN